MTTINEILNEDNIGKYTELIDAATAAEQYGLSDEVDYPFTNFADKQQTRVVKGDLHIQGISVSKQDWCPFNLIVDGNLTVDENIEWNEWNRGSFLYVTGNLNVKNLFLAGCPEVIVCGNLIVSNGIVGSQGDNGGRLVVKGSTKAAITLCVTYFNMELASRPEGKVIAEDFPFKDVDLDALDYDAVAAELDPACFREEEGVIGTDEVKEMLREGKSIFKQ